MRSILIAVAAALLAGCATGYGYSEYGRGYGDYGYYDDGPGYGYYDRPSYRYYDDYYRVVPYGHYIGGGIGIYRGHGYYGGAYGGWGYPWYGGYGRFGWSGWPGYYYHRPPHRPRPRPDEGGVRPPPKGGPLPASRLETPAGVRPDTNRRPAVTRPPTVPRDRKSVV